MSRFFRIQLRTSDVAAARVFYSAVVGDPGLDFVPLHEQAVARGARPHWLGYLHVDDVDRAVAAFVERGGTRLSSNWVSPDGLEAATLRDPGGAILALAKPPPQAVAGGAASSGAPGREVIWYELNTPEVRRARANYEEMFGWTFAEPVDLGPVGVFHPFAWARGGVPIGSMSDIAARPGVHPHWLFHLRVAELEPAVGAVRSAGGTVAATLTLPQGDRIAVCDDPQGAALVLREPTTSL